VKGLLEWPFHGLNYDLTSTDCLNAEEAHIIRLCIHKDKKATELFYKQYYAYLFKVCYRYLRNEDDAKDAVTVSFMKILNNLESYKIENGLIRAWMRKITVNVCLDMIRRIRKFPKENIEDLYHGKLTENEDINHKLELQHIITYIEAMDSPMREIIKLYTIEGYSHSEIANMLEISETYSRFLLSKARKILQVEFKQENINE